MTLPWRTAIFTAVARTSLAVTLSLLPMRHQVASVTPVRFKYANTRRFDAHQPHTYPQDYPQLWESFPKFRPQMWKKRWTTCEFHENSQVFPVAHAT